ncbi:Uncharacterized protein M6B38_210570 [Iris pallida]|uniref:Uncharacterized protein n=1 Tax=Iris pallida TaxID=29817 RepID=A0AAX6E436_IRIPA|nr:Uncharacterized protein M6B38_210570 [Iris pallida]
MATESASEPNLLPPPPLPSPDPSSSAGSGPKFPFWPLQQFQEFIPCITSHYKVYEDAFVQKVKDNLMIAREHPVEVGGTAVAAALLLMRGPRRFLFRNTFGRFQDEEARIVKLEGGLKELNQSLDKLKKENKNIILRASFGEEELQRGRTKIRDAGHEIQRLSNSIYKIESEAADFMDDLRALPGRNAIKLRAEVASMASDLKQQRHELDKQIVKIAEYGIRV